MISFRLTSTVRLLAAPRLTVVCCLVPTWGNFFDCAGDGFVRRELGFVHPAR
jgi:hypothetical protein